MNWELKAIGEKIRRAREYIGWSVEWLAMQAGLTPRQLQIVEEGELDYSANHLAAVVRALKLPPNALFGWREDR